jgi:hypothetical protein
LNEALILVSRANCKIFFATEQEAFNMFISAIEGKMGTPREFWDYRSKATMNAESCQKQNIGTSGAAC